LGKLESIFSKRHHRLTLYAYSKRLQFLVEGGHWHAVNPGFFSTAGVQLTIFRGHVYNLGSQTADIGAGRVWDDVYAALKPHGVNVGGRTTRVGLWDLFEYSWS
jgi:hypothetical protein